jgi:hypothetical protein
MTSFGMLAVIGARPEIAPSDPAAQHNGPPIDQLLHVQHNDPVSRDRWRRLVHPVRRCTSWRCSRTYTARERRRPPMRAKVITPGPVVDDRG